MELQDPKLLRPLGVVDFVMKLCMKNWYRRDYGDVMRRYTRDTWVRWI